ncbi:hypothetical protein E2562_012180 [Oryza meyeriana var. granulata]|uniref:Uncharacterized protein n=1 Tax=Oryza meyeriana var. granulata TaxID=110450 RepID=A0A6G1F7F8_9ORYZ|nr:hypothetical protein E2562_012180 [Oryza meyeriana var. granulata]
MKKVFKRRLPNALLEHVIERPFKTVQDLSEVELAECSASSRQLYTLRKFMDDKMMYYEQAFIDQYLKQLLLIGTVLVTGMPTTSSRRDP